MDFSGSILHFGEKIKVSKGDVLTRPIVGDYAITVPEKVSEKKEKPKPVIEDIDDTVFTPKEESKKLKVTITPKVEVEVPKKKEKKKKKKKVY